MPPLRQRTEDIIYLGQRFLSESQVQLGKRCRGFNRQTLEKMLAYAWPGNVRELRNVVRQAILLCDENDWIGLEHLMLDEAYVPEAGPETRLRSMSGRPQPSLSDAYGLEDLSLTDQVREATSRLERDILTDTLRKIQNNKLKAARLLHVDYKTLLRKIKQYQIVI